MIHLKFSYSNVLIIEKILEIFRKNTREIFGNFPEKNTKFSGQIFRLTSLYTSDRN